MNAALVWPDQQRVRFQYERKNQPYKLIYIKLDFFTLCAMTLFFPPYFLQPLIWTQFFQGHQPKHGQLHVNIIFFVMKIYLLLIVLHFDQMCGNCTAHTYKGRLMKHLPGFPKQPVLNWSHSSHQKKYFLSFYCNDWSEYFKKTIGNYLFGYCIFDFYE